MFKKTRWCIINLGLSENGAYPCNVRPPLDMFVGLDSPQ